MFLMKIFLTKQRRWIKACICNVQYLVLINEKPNGRIKNQRGIRQGDPISPFIFVPTMDYLSRLIHHLEGRKAIKAVSLHNNYNISHLLFADDILIFVEDNDTYINNFQVALSLFELASGLKFNMSKSIISPVNVFANKDESLVNLCGLTSQLFRSYFREANQIQNLFGVKPQTTIHKKLNGWRYNKISKGGRLTIIKSSLVSLPTYHLYTFKAPTFVYKEIEKYWRNFLWKGNSNQQKVHLIKWGAYTTPKDLGCLGIKKVKDTN